MTRGAGRRDGDMWRRFSYGGGAIPYMGPNQASLLYDWTPTLDNVTLNGADAVSVLCRNSLYQSVAGFEMTQAVAITQPLWNVIDADLGGQPTLEFAGAEQMQTASAITLPTQCTVVIVAKDENPAGTRSLFEHSLNYSAANGGLIFYGASNSSAGLHYTGQTIKTSSVPASTKLGYVVSFDLAQAGASAFPLARLNNAALGATGFNASAIGTFRSAALMMGGRAASNFCVGPVARVRVYNGIFTSAQADAEYAYQKARFGLP